LVWNTAAVVSSLPVESRRAVIAIVDGRNAMELRLTEHERQLLLEILQERHSSLIHEIARTDRHDYKHELQQRCSEIEGILTKVQVVEHVPA
jgi:hypothetical protein